MRITPWVVLFAASTAAAKTPTKTYRYRSFYSCGICSEPKGDEVTMYTLVRTGETAILTIDRPDRSTETYRGNAYDVTNRGLRLELSADDEHTIVTTCKAMTIDVGSANAVLVPTKDNSECNSITEWKPRATKKVKVFACVLEHHGIDDIDPVIPRAALFADGPGIESVAINDDCALQGTGFRWIGSPTKVAPVRAEQRR